MTLFSISATWNHISAHSTTRNFTTDTEPFDRLNIDPGEAPIDNKIAVLEQQYEYDLFSSSNLLAIINEEKLPSQIGRPNS